MTDQRIWPPDQPPHQEQPAPPPPEASLRDKVIHALREVFDPEIPVNIYDLGLVYKIDINDASKRVVIVMTLTTPSCPEADAIPGRVRMQVEKIPEVAEAEVDLVWDPPWDQSKMTEDARLMLGLE